MAFTEAAEGISFEAMVAHQQAVGRDRPAGPRTWTPSCPAPARGGSTASNPGRMLHPAQAPGRAQALGGPGHRSSCGRKLATVPGHPGLPPEPAAHPDRRPAHARASTSSPCRAPTPTNSTSTPPIWKPRCAACPGCMDVTSDLQIKNPQVNVDDRPRQGRHPRRHRRSRSRTRSTTPTAPARSPRSTPPTTSTRSSWSCCPSTRRDPAALSHALRPLHPRASSCR